MNSEKETLRKRELELQRLMRQMKFDDLHKSQLYRNMEQELQNIQHNLDSFTQQSNFSTANVVQTQNQNR